MTEKLRFLNGDDDANLPERWPQILANAKFTLPNFPKCPLTLQVVSEVQVHSPFYLHEHRDNIMLRNSPW